MRLNQLNEQPAQEERNVNYSELSDEELSRAVAERLGYKQTGHGWWEDADGKLLDDPAYMPEWATDIGAAWGLVERMHRGVNISVSTELKETYVHVDGVNQGFYHAAAGVAPTAPRAICLAFMAIDPGPKESAR
jgi:LDH2 family malate/lactate/ureidoglycolate dehydrogenase